jgi:membrane-bound lytic murein transglycosylase D
MKDLSTFLSISTFVILLGYISYSEMKRPTANDSFSDEGVMVPEPEEVDDYGHPLPAIAFDLPKNAVFANEPLPLNIPDVRERLDKELQINSYMHSNTIFLIKRANRWLPQMQEILRRYNIPDDFKYLPLIESNLLNVISPRDAVGYWQILAESGREVGLTVNKEVDERYDPLKATEAACKYLSKAYKKFGNWTLVAASYNRGMGGIGRAIEDQKINSYYDLYLNDETSRYVFRIVAIKEIIEHPLKYGFNINPKNLYQPEPLRYIQVNQTIGDLITFANEQGINYKLLKRHNPWLRGEKLTVKKGQMFSIALPAE